MAKYSHIIGGKTAKFIKRKEDKVGHIVLRAQKSERNLARRQALKKKSGDKDF